MDLEFYFGFVFQGNNGVLKDYLTEDQMSNALSLAKLSAEESKQLLQTWYDREYIKIVQYDGGKLFFRSVLGPRVL